jgi:DNA adenine methylase
MIKNIDKTYGNNRCSFLRWAGSKRQLIPTLSEFWKPTHVRYVEPFAGSAALFFHLSPGKALLGDINGELIDAYRQVKTNLEQVLECLSTLHKSKTVYLKLRSQDPSKLSPASRAARFIYLNRYCFNGLYRTNLKGSFNVPYSGNRTGDIPSLQHFAACAKQLSRTKLICASFEKTLEQTKMGDFVYIDPPYTVKNRRIFNEYNPAVFDEASIKRLREWLLTLDETGVSFLVSYADSDEAIYLAGDFNTRYVSVKRNISGFAGNRRTDTELLIYN